MAAFHWAWGGQRTYRPAEVRCVSTGSFTAASGNDSSFMRIRDLPPEGNPGQSVLIRGSQTDHCVA